MNKAEKFWNRMSKNFDKPVKPGKRKLSKNALLTKKHIKNSDTVLEFGCATGTLAIDLAEDVQEIYAIDISSQMIKIAQKKANEINAENITFAHTTINDERFRNESFNVILSFNILHLLENRPKVLKRINQLLKSGGLFISDTPCLGEKKSFISFIQFILSKTGLVPHLNMPKISELNDLLTIEKFQIVESENLKGLISNYSFVARKT